MTRLIAAEFLKLRTTRTFWWLCFAAVALPVLVVVITLASSVTRTEDDARSLLSNIGIIAGLFMLILGVVGAAGEYRHGTITSTFLVAPDRRRVMVAKALAHGLGGLCAGAVGAVLILAISIPWLSAQGHAVGTLDLGAGDVAAIAGGSILYAALAAALGVAFGSLVTSQVAAVVTVLILISVVDPILAGLVDGYGQFSLQGLAMSISGNPNESAGHELFAPEVSGLIYLGYVAIVMGAAALLLPRRDVG